eukprot:5044342-Alexandrium_andersonii.AAC.1
MPNLVEINELVKELNGFDGIKKLEPVLNALSGAPGEFENFEQAKEAATQARQAARLAISVRTAAIIIQQ